MTPTELSAESISTQLTESIRRWHQRAVERAEQWEPRPCPPRPPRPVEARW